MSNQINVKFEEEIRNHWTGGRREVANFDKEIVDNGFQITFLEEEEMGANLEGFVFWWRVDEISISVVRFTWIEDIGIRCK